MYICTYVTNCNLYILGLISKLLVYYILVLIILNYCLRCDTSKNILVEAPAIGSAT